MVQQQKGDEGESVAWQSSAPCPPPPARAHCSCDVRAGMPRMSGTTSRDATQQPSRMLQDRLQQVKPQQMHCLTAD